MYRWTWKVRRTYRNIKRLVIVFAILVGVLYLKKHFNGPVDLSWTHHIREWLETGLKVIVAVILLVIGYKLTRWYLKQRKYSRSNITTIDKMSGEEFEHYLAHFFSQIGYKTKVTPLSGDYGADLVLKKDGVTTVVQAKRYTGKVDGGAIQEVFTSKNIYGAERALVVSNSYFTKNAVQLARTNGVELWDRTRLIQELAKVGIKDNLTPELQSS
ncbi:restriction endonuclease [Paenibacillus aestuarii]|uniref:Restriction endonuclease n=1 Tax=Paenibacillus aestuarii TaxID=516965 RepID=A0ABW0K940_9BACL